MKKHVVRVAVVAFLAVVLLGIGSVGADAVAPVTPVGTFRPTIVKPPLALCLGLGAGGTGTSLCPGIGN